MKKGEFVQEVEQVVSKYKSRGLKNGELYAELKRVQLSLSESGNEEVRVDDLRTSLVELVEKIVLLYHYGIMDLSKEDKEIGRYLFGVKVFLEEVLNNTGHSIRGAASMAKAVLDMSIRNEELSDHKDTSLEYDFLKEKATELLDNLIQTNKILYQGVRSPSTRNLNADELVIFSKLKGRIVRKITNYLEES